MNVVMASMKLAVMVVSVVLYLSSEAESRSLVGDPGMRSDKVRVALESWNFCNGVGRDYFSPSMPSPRFADCADLYCSQPKGSCKAVQKVKEQDNALATGASFPSGGGSFVNYQDPDSYAVEKELYLASLCRVNEKAPDFPWYFWMIMLKNGNYDLDEGMCRYAGLAKPPKSNTGGYSKNYFPCFGKGCMNHPLVFHNWSRPQYSKGLGFSLAGSFYGTYDVQERFHDGHDHNISYFSVQWEKNPKTGAWIFRHKLKVSHNYPWLMLYLRADAISGVSGGYPHETRGLMKAPTSPNFRVRLTLNVTRGGGPQSQFYLVDIGGCWKNDGRPCDGDVATDVTRYSEMIINPNTGSACSATNLRACPPYHVLAGTGERVHRSDKARFPYSAYHFYCAPANAKEAEEPFSLCDPFSNPQSQELVQLLPHLEWGVHGFPSRKGQGWIGDARSWDLDVGALSSRLYFYQDIGSAPAKRVWPSIDVGTEIFRSPNANDMAEWTLSDFDVVSTIL
ncbi:hypothetical protein KI387_033297 [Taxus chinensis]|uniref:DUF7705 domain-containing protein n=1 Tax=Taxus chinensis TaxID=29808 RepID=A0AA38F520_TAXCH|nr:hypothetical protein KI387_033297 [Taxus chinensis]